MDRMLYLAMSGAKQTLHAQAANSHNLANVSTPGFREDLVAFGAAPVRGPGIPSRVYAQLGGPGLNVASGTVNATERDLDVAINGEGWIAVQSPDGSEAYTRAGDLRIVTGGLLVTGAGHGVIGNAGPIAIPPAESVTIGSDGTVSIRPVGEAPGNVVEIDRIKLVNPPAAQLRKGLDGLIRTQDGAPVAPDAGVSLASGAREGSNVNAVDAMVGMIELSRAFEMQVKLMKIAEDNDATDAQLLRMNG